MEDNIADALKMAGSVLLFVIGLSISILMFSQARGSIALILSYSDRESLSIENDHRYYYLANGGDTSRYVGKETIIPTLYRAYKESFKVVFEFPDDDYYLYKQRIEDRETGIRTDTMIYSINFVNNDTGINESLVEPLLDGIIYHNFDKIKGQDKYIKTFDKTPNGTSLYEYLTNKQSSYKIREDVGTFYIQDLGIEGNSELLPENNKYEKRVITYTFEPK